MSDLISRSDVIETANKFSFTDENDRRKHLDFLDYCLKETQTAYDVDAVVEEIKKLERPHSAEEWFADVKLRKTIKIVRKGGV